MPGLSNSSDAVFFVTKKLSMINLVEYFKWSVFTECFHNFTVLGLHAYVCKYQSIWYVAFYITVYLMVILGYVLFAFKKFNFDYVVNLHSNIWENLHIIFNSS